MKKLRQSTVEPVLGTLINFLGMKRVNTRGIKLANKCMLMAAIAYNLKKLMKFTTLRLKTKVAALPTPAVCNQPFAVFLTLLPSSRFHTA